MVNLLFTHLIVLSDFVFSISDIFMDYLMVYKYYYDDDKSKTQIYSFEHPAWNESKVFNGIVYFHDSCEEITDDDMDTTYLVFISYQAFGSDITLPS